jgi:nicotinamide-nucleotide amidase
MKTAEILAVGTELLTPYRSDTNSLYLTGKLNELGIAVRAKMVVRDDRDELAACVRLALDRADLVLLTGGLGPTDDDVTRDAVARVLAVPLEEDAAIVEALVRRFAARGVPMPSINRRQAMVPRGAVVLPNSRGTAPGLWIERGSQVIVLLPGPPRELQPMMEAHVLPRLAERGDDHVLRRRVIKLAGRSESSVDEAVAPVYRAFLDWPVPLETTILAGGNQIELHLSGRGRRTDDALEQSLEAGVTQLAAILGASVFSVDGRTIEEVVGDLLRERHQTIAAAESCTGGLLMGRLTEVSGSSAWVVGGVVAYSNEVKVRELGVPAALIAAHGAVSEPVALAMASGVAARLGATVGVGITGIAGPTGGTPDKPVGTVAMAVWQAPDRLQVRTALFPGDRHTIRVNTTLIALDMVRRLLVGQ